MQAESVSPAKAAVIRRIGQAKVVPVVRIAEYSRVVDIARALQSGGIPLIEITMTGSGVLEAVAQVRAAFGDLCVIGVGTVTTPQAAETAIQAGAQFIVSPILRPKIVERCREREVPVICGAFTPTEAQDAYEAGADMIKIFPIRALGAAYVRDLLAPLPHLRIVPTGGINFDNARAFIDAGAFAVGIGSEIVSQDVVNRADWDAISQRAARALASVR